MFLGSLVIGIYFNAMNVLAYDSSHLYFSSNTLIYSAVWMASLMCILEVLMHYDHTGMLNIQYLIAFIALAVLMVQFLREQVFIDDEQWLKRMISHHSTAITTSRKISERTENDDVRRLASGIVTQQEEEIRLMETLLTRLD
jgi:Domain of unknown function (DUF305)